ncbi:MAG: glycosyltransferase family 4 protein [Armatimonadota bacterium]
MSSKDEMEDKLNINVPDEYELREELSGLKDADSQLFRVLRESMNHLEIAYVSTYPPTECGIATFTKDVLTSVSKYTPFSKPVVLAIGGEFEIEPYDNKIVKFKIVKENKESFIEAARFINDSSIDVVSIQHEYGIYGGPDGEYLIDFMEAIKKPKVATLHTILHSPSPNQKRIMQEIGKQCDKIIVMVKTGRDILLDVYGIDPQKLVLIPHGVPNVHRVSASRVKAALGIRDTNILSTFGLINSGKGLEYVIEAMPKILEKFPNTVYLVLGETHPGVRKYEGEKYRNMLSETIDRLGLHEHVRFNNRFLSLTELVRYLCATDIYITPYLSKDQIVSGTLAYAVGCGKAIISTPYLYAEEILADGRGQLVEFKSSESIANAVIDILSNKDKKESMEQKAYKYGRRAAWFNVGLDYFDTFYKASMKSKQEASKS